MNIAQPLRLLHARSEYGYTTSTVEAMPHEPEAVTAGAQHDITTAAHRRATDHRRQAWAEGRDTIQRGLDQLNHGPLGREYASDLRVIGRVLERLDRTLRT